MKFPFVGGAYTGRSVNVNAQTCRNLMVEVDPTTPDGKVLVNTPGYTEVATATGATVIRGLLNRVLSTFQMYCVIDAELYGYVPSVPGFTSAYTTGGGNTWAMGTATGPVSMELMGLSNGYVAVAVADGQKLNVYNGLAGTATKIQISGTDVQANTVCFIDGRFIADDQAYAGRFVYSDILAPGTWTAFNFATAEGSPDALRAVFSNRRELYLMGEKSIEVWYTTTDGNSPFARYQGGFIETGLAAPYTVAELDNTIVWLATDKKGQLFVAMLGPNYQPIVISTPGINYRLGRISVGSTSGITVKNAWATTYRLAGHECYALTVPMDNSTTTVTIVYDATTKEWHEWGAGTSGAHPALSISTLEDNNRIYGTFMAITGSNKLYRLAPDVYTDNGAAIYRERASFHAADEQDRIRIASLTVDMEEGVSTTAIRTSTLSVAFDAGDPIIATNDSTTVPAGATVAVTLDDGRIFLSTLSAGSSSATLSMTEVLPGIASAGNAVVVYADDRCTLETSKDGGQTWGTAVSLHMGVTTTKALRIISRRIGWARNWTVRFKTSAAVKIVIKGLIAKLWGEV